MCGSNGQPRGSSGVTKFVMNTAQTFSTSQCPMSHLTGWVTVSPVFDLPGTCSQTTPNAEKAHFASALQCLISVLKQAELMAVASSETAEIYWNKSDARV